MNEREYTAFFPFCGIGGGALGFQQAETHLFEHRARFRVIGGIDFDAASCRDFERLVGAPALCRDIATLTPLEVRAFAGADVPDVVFLSPPCKGASGLLSAEKAKTEKYQKMNRLTLDWLELMLATWSERPRLVLLENVPRLKQRAADMLRKARALLKKAGYVFHDGFHECGELGGLAQIRRRYLLVARHPGRCPPLLYQPPKLRVRACGEVLSTLPLPEDPSAGPMHRLPRLSWLNWVRLALIPAGGDWRDLEGVLKDGQARREVFKRHGVQQWTEPAPTVAGSGSNGVQNVADPRASTLEFTFNPNAHRNKYAVQDWEEPAATVIGATRPGSGGPSVADPRVRFGNVDRVTPWEEPVGTITHAPAPSSGAAAVADPRAVEALRVPHAYDHGYGVLSFNEPSPTVAGGSMVGQGAYSVADERYRGSYGVLDWDQSSGTVTGNARTPTGRFSVADPRDISLKCAMRAGAYRVLSWQDAAATITGHARAVNGPFSVADPRKPPPVLPIIIAADGTWHRPLTTLELAVLQSFPSRVNGEPLLLDGSSSSAWRERIGNAVPPKTASAVATQMLVTLLAADTGAFRLNGGLDVWVDPQELRA